MSKPWDALRTPVCNPIGPGEWITCGGTRVRVTELRDTGLSIRFNDDFGLRKISAKSAREIGEFLIEVANQIEGKNNG